MRFVANFRYNLKPQISKDPFTDAVSAGVTSFADIKAGDYDKFDSDCNQTMVGFVLNVPQTTGQSFSLKNHQI